MFILEDELFMDRLFDVAVHTDGELMSWDSFLTLLSVLCRGTLEAKISLLFKVGMPGQGSGTPTETRDRAGVRERSISVGLVLDVAAVVVVVVAVLRSIRPWAHLHSKFLHIFLRVPAGREQ